jgi:drug/metabolite transporter (DMT)-like permease
MPERATGPYDACMAARPPTEDLRRGAVFMLLAALFFAGMGAAVKAASRELPSAMVVFFRNAVGLLVLLPWLRRGGKEGLRTRHLPEHLFRSVMGLAAMVCLFYSIGHMRLADAILVYQSVPLVLPLVERVWLGEPIAPLLWGPIGLGFAGLLFILKPGPDLFGPVALVAVASTLFASVAQVGIRRLTRTEPVTRIVFYFGLISSGLSALPLVFVWRTPSPSLLAVLLAMGALATAGQLCLTRAYSYASAARVGPFLYSGVVFAGVLDFVFWRTMPDRQFVAGALLVSAAAILALRLRTRATSVAAEP